MWDLIVSVPDHYLSFYFVQLGFCFLFEDFISCTIHRKSRDRRSTFGVGIIILMSACYSMVTFEVSLFPLFTGVGVGSGDVFRSQ